MKIRTKIIGIVAVVVSISSLANSKAVAHPSRTSIRDKIQASDVSLETSTGLLSGTLLIPSGKSAPGPVVLIIAGSGMTDRDGNTQGSSTKANPLKLLAEALAERGIASLRYDKRSVGRSAAARLATNTFETQVDDAAAWIAWLAKDPRFRGIGIIGHSEGALIGT
ncbi:MAG: alpha/beta hydrolase, partial [Pyrinomonadaceae bacterium]